MSRQVVIVDTETTSLTPDYETGSGTIWELAIIERATGTERAWRMKPDLSVADPGALRVGKFYERTEGMWPEPLNGTDDLADPLVRKGTARPVWSSPVKLAAEVARLLDDAILVAANPAFDAAFLAAFLRANGQAPTWSYRLRDIGSMAYGYLCRSSDPDVPVPAMWANTDTLAIALGVDPEKFDRHSALGDCELLAAMLDVIGGGAR